MNWNLEGTRINADYYGTPISGIVILSRVKYGGSVQHTIRLDAPITVYGTVRDFVLLDSETILEKSA